MAISRRARCENRAGRLKRPVRPLANDLVHLCQHIIEADPALPISLSLGLIKRPGELNHLRFGLLQEAYASGDHLGYVPIAAGGDRLGGKALQFRWQGHVVRLGYS